MFKKITSHLNEKDETYFEHMHNAWKIVFLLKDVEKVSMTLFIKSVCTLLLVSIFSYLFLGERLNIKQVLGILIGLIGVALIIFNTDLNKKKIN